MEVNVKHNTLPIHICKYFIKVSRKFGRSREKTEEGAGNDGRNQLT